jgi:hypothetical protein
MIGEHGRFHNMPLDLSNSATGARVPRAIPFPEWSVTKNDSLLRRSDRSGKLFDHVEFDFCNTPPNHSKLFSG